MPTTVDFPTLVKQALALFGDVFDNEPARRHFAEYLTGLMVAERKNMGIIYDSGENLLTVSPL